MPLSKPIRWSLLGISAALLTFFGPLFLFMGSNLVGGVLDLVLNRKPVISEVHGNYRLDVPWGTATLQIRSDGRFEESIRTKSGSPRNVSGTWGIGEEGRNYLALHFRPFGMVWDDDHDSTTNLYGINFYKPHFGATYGMINDDLGEKFVRQEASNGK